ncbi:MAG: UDP-3-O-(3-hydroxymyristoyl)glucosamine N-acyltransferase [Syntrophus sp. (in: bacteria)]|nr:UDP-3-O-(3-hydroxymyristoyl)glucosamine N-acyltransferase [Syntrophus sp. (in: bacteria)]
MITLKEIAEAINGRLLGDGAIPISGISSIKEAKKGDITFIADPAYKKYLGESRASAIILGDDLEADDLKEENIIYVKNPAQAYVGVAQLFIKPRDMLKGIHPAAVVSEGVHIGDGVVVSPYVFVGKGTVIEGNVILYPFAYIGENVQIGEDTTIYPHVTVCDGAIIGKRVTIHGGAVIGSDGFGYIWDGKSHMKIPQLGIVEIGDDVEIGANTTIDRASLGRTVIRRGVKIDNLVQIAHNVSIGENSIIVSQVGIAGSAVIGRNVVLAGQVGVKDHTTIGDNVKAGGGTGITKNVPENSLIMGYPHLPHREWAKLQSYLKRLPKLFEKIRKIERKLGLEVENGRN